MATKKQQISKLFSSVRLGNISDLKPEVLEKETNDRKQNSNIINLNILDTNQGQTEDKLETNQGQTEDKLETNQGQTEDKLETNQGQTEDKLETNQGQTEDKLETNQGQTEDKLETNQGQTEDKLETNQGQTENKLETNQGQTEGKLETNQGQTKDKLETNQGQTEGKLETNQGQTEDKLETNQGQTTYESSYNLTYSSLSGLQKRIVMTIYDLSYQEKDKTTKELTIDELASKVNAAVYSIKKTINRLVSETNVLIRVAYKNGRGGWTKYKLCTFIFNELKLLRVNTENNNPPIYNSNTTTNTINKYSNDTKEQKPTNTQNDQLIDLIKKQNDQFQQQIAELQKQFLQQAPQTHAETKNVTATDETNTLESDNEDWADLDFSSLTEFGFTKRHVTQIKNFNKNLDADNQLTVDSVQESIEHYGWALRNRLEEMKGYAPDNNRLRGLIGVLKKGGNWTEANYKSPEDLAFEASLIAKKERLEKIKAQKEEVFNLEFELWRESLTATEITDIEEKGELQGKMPPSAFKNKGDNKMYVAALRTYFKQNIYKG
ncbi:hypothetical protein [Cysteiniphilum marinum]|uniref:hypothetical protein n=1 Tax=Cysteiniphilum marinum TaxID=2774191 RepID=UPI00193BCD7F|nr:hypothetical protein [Cysteiniphilum marinum]